MRNVPPLPSTSFPLPCILAPTKYEDGSEVGWHLSSFGSASELVWKIRNTCCEHTKFRDSDLYSDEDKMERIKRAGTPYFQVGGTVGGLKVRKHEGGGNPTAVEECAEKTGGKECGWIEEFFDKPLTEGERYTMEQDVLQASYEQR